jgi:hypothetical protein
MPASIFRPSLEVDFDVYPMGNGLPLAVAALKPCADADQGGVARAEAWGRVR